MLVLATDRVTTEVLASMRKAAARTNAPAVLVTNEVGKSGLMARSRAGGHLSPRLSTGRTCSVAALWTCDR
ncbi:hypothetical protein [Saccharopolyspora sp. NPDC002376]